MGYEEEPDYEALKNLFRKIMERNGYVDDKQFDWMLLKNNMNADNTNMSNNVRLTFVLFHFEIKLNCVVARNLKSALSFLLFHY
jgi:hypothetical protein